jgi:hypothetical protein
MAKSYDQYHSHYRSSGNCNIFSSRNGRGCEPWCADFAQYVWTSAGIAHPNSGLVAAWAQWARSHHLWHSVTVGTFTSPGYSPQPGDLMVYGSAHLGIYTGPSASGPLSTNGNFPDGVYTYPHMMTNTGKPQGTSLTGFIEMPVSTPSSTTTSTIN